MTRARIQHSNGAKPPENPRGRNYWNMIKDVYPHHIEVPYMSKQDMDPRSIARTITKDFKRVPFEGITHFGFVQPQHLEQFKKAIGL